MNLWILGIYKTLGYINICIHIHSHTHTHIYPYIDTHIYTYIDIHTLGRKLYKYKSLWLGHIEPRYSIDGVPHMSGHHLATDPYVGYILLDSSIEVWLTS